MMGRAAPVCAVTLGRYVSIRSRLWKCPRLTDHACGAKAICIANYNVTSLFQCGGAAPSPGFVFFFRDTRFSASTNAEKAMAA